MILNRSVFTDLKGKVAMPDSTELHSIMEIRSTRPLRQETRVLIKLCRCTGHLRPAIRMSKQCDLISPFNSHYYS